MELGMNVRKTWSWAQAVNGHRRAQHSAHLGQTPAQLLHQTPPAMLHLPLPPVLPLPQQLLQHHLV
jgi:hypothetical protein